MSRNKSPKPRPAAGSPFASHESHPLSSRWVAQIASLACIALWTATVTTINDSNSDATLFCWTAVLWGLLAVALLGVAAWSRVDILKSWQWVDTLCAAWLAWQAFTVVTIVNKGNVRLALNGLLQSVTMVMIYTCVRATTRRAEDRWRFVVAAIALVSGLAAVGLYQNRILQPREVAAFQSDPEKYLGPLAAEYPPDSPQRKRLEDRLRSSEPTATFALANSYAVVLATWLIVVVGWSASRLRERGSESGCEPPGDKPPDYRSWLVMAGVALLLGVVLLLTKSRTSLLALILGIAFVGVRQFGKWGLRAGLAGVAALVVVAAVGIALFSLGVWDIEVFSESPKSMLYRLEYWYTSSKMILDHPLQGVGLGNFQAAYTQHKLPQASETVADPHNFVFEVFSTTGIVGGLLALATLGCAIGRCLPTVRNGTARIAINPNQPKVATSPEPTRFDVVRLSAIGLGLLCALGINFLSQMLNDAVVDALLVLCLPVAIGVSLAIDATTRRKTVDVETVLLGVGVLLINLLAAGGWSFPSVASSLWALLAIGSNIADESTQNVGDAPASKADKVASPMPIATLIAMVVAGLWVVGIARFHTVPTVTASTNLLVARERIRGRDLPRAIERATEAETVDPWSDDAPFVLAQVYWLQYSKLGNEGALKKFEEALHRRAARSPRSAALRTNNGDQFAIAYRETGDSHWLMAATTSYQEALARYPASSTISAQLALVELAGGDLVAARRHADQAHELDAKNPHPDKKLAAIQLTWPFPDATRFPPSAEVGEILARGLGAENTAEQIVEELRSKAAETR